MQQFLGLQAASTVGPLQRCGYIRHVSKNRISLSGTQIRGGGGLLQHQIHIFNGICPDIMPGLASTSCIGLVIAAAKEKGTPVIEKAAKDIKKKLSEVEMNELLILIKLLITIQK